MKQTSIRAYHAIKEDGTLTRLQRKLYEAIKNHGPITGRQLNNIVPGGWKRLSELQSIGVITIMGTTIDSETKKCVNAYIANYEQPLVKNPTKRRPSYKALQLLMEKYKNGQDLSRLYAKAYEQGYSDAKLGYSFPEEL